MLVALAGREVPVQETGAASDGVLLEGQVMGIPGREAHFKFPTTGPVGVLFDPKSRNVKWDRDDPRVYSDQDRAKEQGDLDAALRAPAGSQSVVETSDDAAGPNEDADKSIELARQMWRENLKQGKCTQEEFDRQMRDLEESSAPHRRRFGLSDPLFLNAQFDVRDREAPALTRLLPANLAALARQRVCGPGWVMRDQRRAR